MNEEPFNVVQLQQLRLAIKEAVHEEFADTGIRLDSPEQQDEARADFLFIRKMRRGVNGMVSKIGWAIIVAVVSGFIFIITQGLNFWKGTP